MATTENPDSLGAGLRFEDRMSVRWHALAVDPTEARMLALSNEETLRAILSLDDHPGETAEESKLSPELARIETRLNLVLDLVSQVLAQQLALPQAVPVVLSARTASWKSSEPMMTGPGMLEIYVSNRYPRALQLPATLVAKGAGVVEATFASLGAEPQELLEQLIFRHHRRQVAAARRNSRLS